MATATRETVQHESKQTVPQLTQTEQPCGGGIPLWYAIDNLSDASPDTILALQQRFGNRAVQRLFDRSVQRKPLDEGELDPNVSDAINRSRGAGQPLSHSVRSPMERSFQPALRHAVGQVSDFSAVYVHTDEQADRLNRSIQAKAITLGSDIYFRKGNYNPSTTRGKELIAHELAHVIQQGGAANRVQGKLTLGPAGDRYEQEADRAAAGAINTGQIRRAQPRIQRWAALGPWGPGWEKGAQGSAPVHETMTTMAMRNATYGGVKQDTTFHDPSAWEMAGRGAVWNDDPEGLLHDTTSLGFGLGKPTTQKYSSGILFAKAFKKAEKKALRGEQIGPQDRMTARSHFGDLQFLHGMALAGEEAATTQANMLMWTEFTYRVGRGEIPITTRIQDVPNSLTGKGHKEKFRALFPPNVEVAQLNVEQFFGVKEGGPGDAKARAIGSLLHMVEDSFTESHTEREELGGGLVGRIKSFHAFAGQDKALHHRADLPSGEGRTTEERIRNTPHAMQAVDIAKRVLEMLNESDWTPEVEMMFKDILGLVEHPEPAGPGARFVADR